MPDKSSDLIVINDTNADIGFNNNVCPDTDDVLNNSDLVSDAAFGLHAATNDHDHDHDDDDDATATLAESAPNKVTNRTNHDKKQHTPSD